jgi:hypothetical protein
VARGESQGDYEMQTRIRERQAPAVAGLAVIGGVAVWQLGLEFERAWLRSYEGPLLGETLPALTDTPDVATELADSEGSTTGAHDGRRRWVTEHHPRRLQQTRNGASSSTSWRTAAQARRAGLLAGDLAAAGEHVGDVGGEVALESSN